MNTSTSSKVSEANEPIVQEKIVVSWPAKYSTLFSILFNFTPK